MVFNVLCTEFLSEWCSVYFFSSVSSESQWHRALTSHAWLWGFWNLLPPSFRIYYCLQTTHNNTGLVSLGDFANIYKKHCSLYLQKKFFWCDLQLKVIYPTPQLKSLFCVTVVFEISPLSWLTRNHLLLSASDQAQIIKLFLAQYLPSLWNKKRMWL